MPRPDTPITFPTFPGHFVVQIRNFRISVQYPVWLRLNNSATPPRLSGLNKAHIRILWNIYPVTGRFRYPNHKKTVDSYFLFKKKVRQCYNCKAVVPVGFLPAGVLHPISSFQTLTAVIRNAVVPDLLYAFASPIITGATVTKKQCRSWVC